MKKYIALVLILILTIAVIVLSLCYYNAKKDSDTNYNNFDNLGHLHYISNKRESCIDCTVIWESNTGIKVIAHRTGRQYFFSEGTYIISSNRDSCPFCTGGIY